MLIVAKEGYEEKVKEIFKKWDLDAVVVGKVTDNGMLTLFFKNEKVAEIPVKPIADEAPVYDRPVKEPENMNEIHELYISKLNLNRDYNETLEELMGNLNLASKKWVYEQYDHMVRINSVVLPGSDSAVVRIKGTKKAVAISTDCNSRYCYLDPFVGSQIAVCEAARNVACSGAKPMAITDCLNFGNPEKPEIMWQFKKAVEGMSEACKILETPVVSGNVSFYNETIGTPIFPTPTVGMVGLIENIDNYVTQWFKNKGDKIILIGETKEELGGSEYLAYFHDLVKGTPPAINVEHEKVLINTLLELSENKLINSAHDLSEGGFAVALAECCITGPNPIGASVDFSLGIDDIYLLFSETQSRVIVTCGKDNLKNVEKSLNDSNLYYQVIGEVGGNFLKINNLIDVDIDALKRTYYTSMERYVR